MIKTPQLSEIREQIDKRLAETGLQDRLSPALIDQIILNVLSRLENPITLDHAAERQQTTHKATDRIATIVLTSSKSKVIETLSSESARFGSVQKIGQVILGDLCVVTAIIENTKPNSVAELTRSLSQKLPDGKIFIDKI